MLWTNLCCHRVGDSDGKNRIEKMDVVLRTVRSFFDDVTEPLIFVEALLWCVFFYVEKGYCRIAAPMLDENIEAEQQNKRIYIPA